MTGLTRVSGRLRSLVGGPVESVVDRVRERRVEVKTPAQVEAMRAAGLVVAAALSRVSAAVRAGVSTAELDEIAETTIREAGAVPSFLGYHGFPGSVCVSVNEQVVHGIPSTERTLVEGDLVSIDCGAILDGWHGDAAVTVSAGEPRPADEVLSDACRASMWAGIAQVRPGARLGDVSAAVAEAAGRHGPRLGIVEEYGGHGIGTSMHMDPFVPNLGRAGSGLRLRVGMVLAIEPMLTAGTADVVVLDDDWTVVTGDGERAAHWEHSVAVTEDGPWVLTAPLDA